MRYRAHKGGLAESLNTTRNVYSKIELLNYLNKQHSALGKVISDLKFKHVGMDKRTGWNTYYVLIKLQGQENFSVVGMSDANNFDYPKMPVFNLKKLSEL